MNELISLTCINCGGALQVTDNRNQFYCSYCGHHHALKNDINGIQVSSVIEGLSDIQTGTDKTASELAIVRLTDEMAAVQSEYWKTIIAALNVEMTEVTRCIIAMVGKPYVPIINVQDTINYMNGEQIDMRAMVVDYAARVDKGYFNFNKGTKMRAYGILKNALAKYIEHEEMGQELAQHRAIVRM